MTYNDARHYIWLACKEGYMTDEEADRLFSLPKKQMIKECEEMGSKGDTALNALLKNE